MHLYVIRMRIIIINHYNYGWSDNTTIIQSVLYTCVHVSFPLQMSLSCGTVSSVMKTDLNFCIMFAVLCLCKCLPLQVLMLMYANTHAHLPVPCIALFMYTLFPGVFVRSYSQMNLQTISSFYRYACNYGQAHTGETVLHLTRQMQNNKCQQVYDNAWTYVESMLSPTCYTRSTWSFNYFPKGCFNYNAE